MHSLNWDFIDDIVVGGGIVGLIVALWSRLSILWNLLAGLVLTRVVVGDIAVGTTLIHLRDNYKRINLGNRLLWGKGYRMPDEFVSSVLVDVIPDGGAIFYGHKKIFLASKGSDAIHLTTIRGVCSLSDIALDAVNECNVRRRDRTKGSRFYVKRVYGAGRGAEAVVEDRSEKKGGDPDGMATGWAFYDPGYNPIFGVEGGKLAMKKGEAPGQVLILPEEVEGLISEAHKWINAEEWFRDRKLPWRRGWLLHGAAGVGKTSTSRALGKELGIPIHALDLASMDNEGLSQAWRAAAQESPCIVLMEDIDAVFHGRKNASRDGRLTFDAMLNVVDGADQSSGILLICTTNNVEHLDPAMSRPGRLDRIVQFPSKLPRAGRERIAQRILPNQPEVWEEIVDAGANQTPAEFQERCQAVALESFWQDNQRTRFLG